MQVSAVNIINTVIISFTLWLHSNSAAATAPPANTKTPLVCAQSAVNNHEKTSISRQLNHHVVLPKEAKNKRIDHISYVQKNIFNPQNQGEDFWLFNLANELHVVTDTEVLASVLLFQQGSLYDIEQLQESERLLRQQRYLYDAQISAQDNCQGGVDVIVYTRELWTLLPEISFSRKGGENHSSFGFRDSNFLGTGKRVSITRTNKDNRSGYEFIYDDPNILSSRYQGRFEYADNSDGERHWLSLTYPFFAVDTPYSYGISSGSNRRIETLYHNTNTVSEFEQQSHQGSLFWGYAKKINNQWTRRIITGYHYNKHRFNATDHTHLPLAKNRTLSYPYLQLNYFEDDYIKVHNIDSISRTEDLNLGWQINALVGYSPHAFSHDDSRWVYRFSAAKTHFINHKSLWRWRFALNGTWNKRQQKAENLLTQSQFQYFYNTSDKQSWYAKLQLDVAHNLTADKQLHLGGESGLRGYPQYFQQGDRRVIASIEKRYYWEYDLWRLFKVGGAAFYDVGRAWFSQHASTKWQHNLGVGLRLAPSRAHAGTVVHLDVAYPLNAPEQHRSLQWLVSVKNTF